MQNKNIKFYVVLQKCNLEWDLQTIDRIREWKILLKFLDCHVSFFI